MYMDPDELESWRIFFNSSGVNIFDIINKAIIVAAKDYASHLKLRRGQIVSLLYHDFSPCNQPELSVPLEGANFFQPNADAYCRNCSQVDEHHGKNRRIDHVDYSLSMDPSKSFMIESNDEKKMAEPTNAMHGSKKEAAVSEHDDRSQQVEHQDQTLLLTLAKNTTIGLSDDTLGSDGVSNRRELNSLDNENITVMGSSDLENVGFNGILNDKDVDLPVILNKTFADQNVESRKLVSFNVTSDGKSLELCQVLHKNLSERSHNAVDGELALSSVGGSPSERAGAMTDLVAGDETHKEVLKAKSILEDWKNQSDMMLLDLLMKLRSLELNISILKATLIGKTVRALQRHASKEIRDAARALIRYWKAKVDEWVHEDAAVEEDQPPCGILNEGDTVAPTCTTLLQVIEDLDKTDFSVLPSENVQGTLYFNKELNSLEEELLRICTNPGRTGMTDSTREEDLQHPLPIPQVSIFSENKQPPTDKNELERFGVTEIMKEEDSITKNMRISQSNELQNVEETRRKIQEGYNSGEDVKRRHAMNILNVNHHTPNQELKRHKHYHAISEN